MSEEINNMANEMPESAGAQAQAQAQINLELEPQAPELKEAEPSLNAASSTAQAKPEAAQEVKLSEAEQKMVDDFSEKIDLTDSNIILQYGAASQKKISEFSDTALEGVKTKDLGEVGKDLSALVTELKGFSIEGKEKGIGGWFHKKANSLVELKSRYTEAENNVDKICGVLQDHQNQLSKDIIMLDKMYETNLVYFKELTMYILAGKKKLEHEQKTTLVELQNKAKESGLASDAQKANDYAELLDRFDKKLYDLELTKTVSLQMAPQIRLIQNSDALMVEKIQSTLNNTIPLWKNQMVLALGVAHSQEALKTQKEVNDFTNELIQKNATMLHQGAVEIAKESERGIIDLETVQKANSELLASLDEVIQIQEDGRIKRREAETQLGIAEAELKQKLLDIRNNSVSNSPVKPQTSSSTHTSGVTLEL